MFVITFFNLINHKYSDFQPSSKIVLNASVTDSPFLSFSDIIHHIC